LTFFPRSYINRPAHGSLTTTRKGIYDEKDTHPCRNADAHRADDRLGSSSTTTRTAKARDACSDCQAKVNALYNACADLYGENAYCGDIFNDGIVYCYATVCEQ
jgi:hypothetical protein